MDAPSSRPSRRGLLGGALGCLGLAAAGPARSASAAAATTTWSLRALLTTYTLPDGAVLPFARLEHVGAGTTHGRIPVLEAVEGQSVALTLQNTLPYGVRPCLVGIQDGPAIPAGATAVFSFTMPSAGSYLLGPALARRTPAAPSAGPLALQAVRPMDGFAAQVISRPSGGGNVLWNGGPSFDREVFLLYEDVDDRFSPSVAGGPPPAGVSYHPNYFLLNGNAYPDTTADRDSVVTGSVGQRILLRLGNLGRMRQSVHVHGYHVEVVARDNVPEAVLGEKDTVPVPARTTTDVILAPQQAGTFPLHPHSLTAVTANGFYPMGQLTLISIS